MYMAAKVPISETGTATLGTSVARPLRRNRNTTRMTRITEMASVRSTSLSDARIVVERSTAAARSIAGEIAARNSGSNA